MSKTLIVHETKNRLLRWDGDYFTACAKRFEDSRIKAGDTVVRIPLEYGPREYGRKRAQLERTINVAALGHETVTTFAFFGHGTRNWLSIGESKAMFSLIGGAYFLASILSGVLARDARVILYACSTAEGKGDNCFARHLRIALELMGYWQGVLVFAHTTPGRATRNPYVYIYKSRIDHGFLVDPGSHLFPKWQLAIGNEKNDLDLEFPYLTQGAIYAMLQDSAC